MTPTTWFTVNSNSSSGPQSRLGGGLVSGCDGHQEVGMGPEVAEQIKPPPRLWRDHRKRTVAPEMGRRGRVHALVLSSDRTENERCLK